MERYKGFRVPTVDIKSGTLLQKLADREQTTSDDILHFATKPAAQQQTTVGPHTSTEELLEALDLAIGPEKDGIEDHTGGEPDPVLTQGEIQDGVGEASKVTPAKKGRKKVEKAEKAESQTAERPRFVELTRLLPPVPKKGSFEVDSVKKSLYFFS